MRRGLEIRREQESQVLEKKDCEDSPLKKALQNIQGCQEPIRTDLLRKIEQIITCYGIHGMDSHNSMKITTTIDIPEETVLEAKYILLAHRNASEHRLLSSFYRSRLLALVDQCADGKLIRWPVEFVVQDRCDASFMVRDRGKGVEREIAFPRGSLRR